MKRIDVMVVLVALAAVLVAGGTVEADGAGPFETLWKAECPVVGKVTLTAGTDGSTGVVCQVWDRGRQRRPEVTLWKEACPVFGWVTLEPVTGGTVVFCDVWD